MIYAVPVVLLIEAREGEARSVAKSASGLIEMLVAEDEPPHQLIDFKLGEAMPQKDFEMLHKEWT